MIFKKVLCDIFILTQSQQDEAQKRGRGVVSQLQKGCF